MQKIIKVGTSAAVVLPKDIMKDLHFKAGEAVSVVAHPEKGEVVISRPVKNEKIKEVSDWSDKFIKKYKKALDALSDK